jgi:YfiH family protein
MVYWQWQAGLRPHWVVKGFDDIDAWVTSRLGGTSFPPFASLNVSEQVGDLPAAVRENRRRALIYAGSPRGRVWWGRLVHADAVFWVEPTTTTLPPADILWTTELDTTLAMTYADCVPLLLGASGKAVGIAHSGWRGAALNVAGRAVAAAVARGIPVDALRVAIGPAIGPCCYVVGETVAEQIRRAPSGSRFLTPDAPGTYRLDLPGLTKAQLVAAGVPPGHIAASPACTGCDTHRLFSHRREAGRTGRFGAFVVRSGLIGAETRSVVHHGLTGSAGSDAGPPGG